MRVSFPGTAGAGNSAERSSAARRRRGGRGRPESRSPSPQALLARQRPPPGPPPGGAGAARRDRCGRPREGGFDRFFCCSSEQQTWVRAESRRWLGAWPRGPTRRSVPFLRLACLTRPLQGQKPGDGGCYTTEPFTGSLQHSHSPEQEPLSASLPLGCPS